jgi:hypothetical protein
MAGNKNAPQGRAMGQKRGCADDRANDRKARFQYTAFLLDDKLPDAFARLRKATPEPRLCVYGVPESVPHYRGYRWTI